MSHFLSKTIPISSYQPENCLSHAPSHIPLFLVNKNFPYLSLQKQQQQQTYLKQAKQNDGKRAQREKKTKEENAINFHEKFLKRKIGNFFSLRSNEKNFYSSFHYISLSLSLGMGRMRSEEVKKGMRKLVNYVSERERVRAKENIYHEPWKLVSLSSFVNVIYFLPLFFHSTQL